MKTSHFRGRSNAQTQKTKQKKKQPAFFSEGKSAENDSCTTEKSSFNVALKVTTADVGGNSAAIMKPRGRRRATLRGCPSASSSRRSGKLRQPPGQH